MLPSLPVLMDNLGITDDVFEWVYDECIAFLQERVSYLWKERCNPREYNIGTWSASSIKKFGTDRDKSYLTEPTSRNSNKRNGSRKRSRSTNVKYPTRQERAIRRAREQQADQVMQGEDVNNNGGDDEGGSSFVTAFAHVGELTEAIE